MKLIAGLGNPGTRYELTRHNIGFILIDILAAELGIRFREGKGDWYEAKGKIGNEDVMLLKPVSYMNNSGIVVKDFMEKNGINKEDVLIVVDDFQLPLGTIRVRKGGSDGGHNGIASIIYELSSDEFPRMRVGIGKGSQMQKEDHVDFVLDNFRRDEIEVIKDLVPYYTDCMKSFVSRGVAATMNNYNKSFLKKDRNNSDSNEKEIKEN